jgi:soluble lytic murein transglycosylase-like protein
MIAAQTQVRMAYYPMRRRPIPLVILMFLIAACVYGLLYPFLQTGIFTCWWYHLTSSIPLVSEAPPALPADKQGYVALAQADALAAGIPPDLFLRQINQESGFNPDSLSPAGAEGIAQFMPDTADGLGINPWNPVDALAGAAQLMARCQHNYGGDYAKALAAYNGGSGTLQHCLRQYGSRWLSCEPAETQAYIQKIMNS